MPMTTSYDLSASVISFTLCGVGTIPMIGSSSSPNVRMLLTITNTDTARPRYPSTFTLNTPITTMATNMALEDTMSFFVSWAFASSVLEPIARAKSLYTKACDTFPKMARKSITYVRGLITKS